MVTHDDTAYKFAYVTPGEQHEVGPRLIPIVDAQGQLRPEPGDGNDPVRVTARRFLRNVGVLRDGASPAQLAEAIISPPVLFANKDFDLVVTNSRVVIIGNQVSENGKRLLGQIRFPWIQSVGFRPKQSFLNDAELVIRAAEDFGAGGPSEGESGRFEHTFTFVFPKQFHPGSLAQVIARRAASFVAQMPGTPTSQELLDLATVGILPDPPKGEHAEYYSKVFCVAPDGDYQLSDGQHEVDWVVANI